MGSQNSNDEKKGGKERGEKKGRKKKKKKKGKAFTFIRDISISVCYKKSPPQAKPAAGAVLLAGVLGFFAFFRGVLGFFCS
jgi:hypothetical protein